MALTDIFIKRPVLSVVVSLLISDRSRAASARLIRQYPKLSNTVINVTTVYPGASANLIQVSSPPIEQGRPAEGVDYITIVGRASTIQVYIKLNSTRTRPDLVLAKVNSVKYLIPKESNDPIVTKTTGRPRP
jgi:multidrug efflux pump